MMAMSPLLLLAGLHRLLHHRRLQRHRQDILLGHQVTYLVCRRLHLLRLILLNRLAGLLRLPRRLAGRALSRSNRRRNNHRRRCRQRLQRLLRHLRRQRRRLVYMALLAYQALSTFQVYTSPSTQALSDPRRSLICRFPTPRLLVSPVVYPTSPSMTRCLLLHRLLLRSPLLRQALAHGSLRLQRSHLHGTRCRSLLGHHYCPIRHHCRKLYLSQLRLLISSLLQPHQ